MAGSVNRVILIGNLGRDPEVRTFQNGGKIVNLRIATSETWRDKSSGERKERKALTKAEQKAKRDQRYAARKARQ